MGKDTKIGWADDTWNFLAGCTRVSEGCRNCYAERNAATRLAHLDKYKGLALMTPSGPRWSREVRVIEKEFLNPDIWNNKSRIVFVNSMSDVFHEDVREETLFTMATIIRANPAKRFLILTKRADMMNLFMRNLAFRPVLPRDDLSIYGKYASRVKEVATFSITADPPKNMDLGVSVEAAEFLYRISRLEATVCGGVRFISAEPLIGELSLREFFNRYPNRSEEFSGKVGWVIVGGESGPKSRVRPMRMEWVKTLYAECKEFGIPFFFKQLGKSPDLSAVPVKECNQLISTKEYPACYNKVY